MTPAVGFMEPEPDDPLASFRLGGSGYADFPDHQRRPSMTGDCERCGQPCDPGEEECPDCLHDLEEEAADRVDIFHDHPPQGPLPFDDDVFLESALFPWLDDPPFEE